MRINELVGIKNKGLDDLRHSLDQATADHPKNSIGGGAVKRKEILTKTAKKLESQGYQRLGSGSYATVFADPKSDYCIKLFSNDPEYLRFVDFCQKNNTACLPKFRGKNMKINDYTFAVRMEKLQPIPLQDPFFIEVTCDLRTFVESGISAKVWIKDRLESGYGRNLGEYYLTQPGLLETLEKLTGMVDMFNWDLGINNVMMRGKTLVITDPWAE